MSEAVAWRSRIIGEEEVAPDQLLANPANWRIHPKSQQQALASTLDQVGWVQRVIVNQRTGHVVDGHLRVELAMRRAEPTVPVLYVDLSADEERVVLASLDPLATMAATDADKLAELLAETAISDDALAAMLTEMSQAADAARQPEAPKLVDAFIVPPFSVLDARAGYWQDRKRQWLAFGIRSEIGRGTDMLNLNRAYELQQGSKPKGKKKGVTFGIGNMADWQASIRQRTRPEGTLYQSFSGLDPEDYEKKNRAEAQLGRQLTPEEFERSGLYQPPDTGSIADHGTSVFDPVLTELVYRWFSAPGASILDPFAGGSVRGIVAAMTDRDYTGIELRGEQVEANRQQVVDILQPPAGAVAQISDPDALTPVERRGDAWVKRDDAFTFAGVAGGKVRSCLALARTATTGLVTAGARQSPQANIVAQIGAALGLPVRIHAPAGQQTPELEAAQAAGAEVVMHEWPKYNNVIVSKARADAAASGWTEIPFGMECEEAVRQTRRQVANLPAEVQRIVMPVGSGMSLAGVLHGLRDIGRDVPVLGVVVGADPAARLDEYAPDGWRDQVTLIPSGSKYQDEAPTTSWRGIELDGHYEAKAAPHVQAGDLLWVVGIRQTQHHAPREQASYGRVPRWIEGDSTNVAELAPGEYDLVFSCPPYADLEVYSDDPRDLSTMPYAQFLEAYRAIIARSCALLRQDRFAVFVVGEVRGAAHGGAYLNFVGDTVRAFEDAGLRYYNEAILVTPLGSLPVRAAKHMKSSRKLGKTHQNVLVFVKGDPIAAARAAGEIEIEMPGEMLSAWQDDA